jgi:hypothetical protein
MVTGQLKGSLIIYECTKILIVVLVGSFDISLSVIQCLQSLRDIPSGCVFDCFSSEKPLDVEIFHKLVWNRFPTQSQEQQHADE